jgi:hypothetical protein
MNALLLSVFTEEAEPETTEPEEGYSIAVIPANGRSAEEWDELAKRGEA